MSRQEEDTKAEISPMMTEQGREELYLYSLRKMAEERADSDKQPLRDFTVRNHSFLRPMNVCSSMKNYSMH